MLMLSRFRWYDNYEDLTRFRPKRKLDPYQDYETTVQELGMFDGTLQ